MPKSRLNCHDRSDRMRWITKTKRDNDVIDRKVVISIEYNIELLRSNGQYAIYGEDEIGQWRDWLYKFTLCWKWNWTVMTYITGYGLWWRPNRTMTWLIVQVRFTPILELNCHDPLDWMWYIMKSRQNKDMIDRIGVIPHIKREFWSLAPFLLRKTSFQFLCNSSWFWSSKNLYYIKTNQN